MPARVAILAPSMIADRFSFLRAGTGGAGVLFVLLALGVSPARAAEKASSGHSTLVDSVMAGIGGPQGWEHARYLAFDFVVHNDSSNADLVRRSHRWDRYTGEYRVSGKTRDGKAFEVHFNVNDRKGAVTIDGAPADDSTRAKWLDRAYGIFINDSYWLLMPFKLKDPGVHVEEMAMRTDSTGHSWRVLHLSFDQGTGLTSKDQYWVYVDPKSGRVGRWDFLLQDDPPGSAPSTAMWQNWEHFGPIWLATEKPMPARKMRIRFENVAVSETIPKGAFQ